MWRNRGLSRLLYPFSWTYRCAVAIRNARFDRNKNRSVALPARVISVGNITVGGTGKTPLVISLAEWLQKRGKEVAILSRGYGRKTPEVLTVSDGHYALTDPTVAGDEPVLMASRLHKIPVIVGKNRLSAGQMCIDQYGSKILILDDGFQHRQIKRNLDIVVIDALEPFGNRWLLPAGPLREPLKSLARADVVILSRTDLAEGHCDAVVSQVRRFTDAPIFHAIHWAKDWIEISTHKTFALEELCGRFCLAFSGIGNPDAFHHTLSKVGIKMVGFLRYPDHHLFTEKDLNHILLKAEKKGAVAIITTEKDGVRLPSVWRPRIPVYALRVEFRLDEGREALTQMIERERTL
jgi:tetraacyldisaccharide 4'-kinase